jgi:hypothetical protein
MRSAVALPLEADGRHLYTAAMHIFAPPLILIALIAGLSGCDRSAPAGGGNVAMRDMEVVDGTANDAMVDMDNAAIDGTPFTNEGAASMASSPEPAGNSATPPAPVSPTSSGSPASGNVAAPD